MVNDMTGEHNHVLQLVNKAYVQLQVEEGGGGS